MKMQREKPRDKPVAQSWRIWTGADNHTWAERRIIPKAASTSASAWQRPAWTGNVASGQRGLCFSVCRLWVQLFTRMNTPGRPGDSQVAILTACLEGGVGVKVPQRSDFRLSRFTPTNKC